MPTARIHSFFHSPVTIHKYSIIQKERKAVTIILAISTISTLLPAISVNFRRKLHHYPRD